MNTVEESPQAARVTRDPATHRIKLLVPKMPTTDALIPYLRRIDEARWYTNFGQLEQELRARLSERYGGAHVVTTSSCTAGLELAFELRKQMGLESVTISPLTFQATALAAHRAGLRVDFRDPDHDTWSDGTVAVFGLPAYRGPIVDAAAAFGEQKVPQDLIAVFSLHATKAIGAGEGGFIVTHNAGEAEELRRMTNFGFLDGSRAARFGVTWGVSRGPGTNAKLSEYGAAVALASLDAWDRAPWLQLFDWYEKHLPAYAKRQDRPRGVYPIMAVKLPVAAMETGLRLAALGIETRRWYYPPLNQHQLFAAGARGSYPVTEDLGRHLLGLPYHLFLTEEDVARVCASLRSAVEGM